METGMFLSEILVTIRIKQYLVQCLLCLVDPIVRFLPNKKRREINNIPWKYNCQNCCDRNHLNNDTQGWTIIPGEINNIDELKKEMAKVNKR